MKTIRTFHFNSLMSQQLSVITLLSTLSWGQTIEPTESLGSVSPGSRPASALATPQVASGLALGGKKKETPTPSKPLAWLGCEVGRPDEAVRAQLPQLPVGVGFVINKVIANGPVAEAGLQPLDVLWKFNDQWLINEAQLSVLLLDKQPGDRISLTFFRAGKQQVSQVVLAAVPAAAPQVAGPTLQQASRPNGSAPNIATRTVDINSRSARLEDNNCVVQLEMRDQSTWLTIQNQDGSIVYDGVLSQENLASIPPIWMARVEALRRTLENRVINPCHRPRLRTIVPVTPSVQSTELNDTPAPENNRLLDASASPNIDKANAR